MFEGFTAKGRKSIGTSPPPMEQQLGLKLLPVKGPRVYYTIQNVERPTLD